MNIFVILCIIYKCENEQYINCIKYIHAWKFVCSNKYSIKEIFVYIREYDTNSIAYSKITSIWDVYRIGGILKIRMDHQFPIVSLAGSNTIVVSKGD